MWGYRGWVLHEAVVHVSSKARGSGGSLDEYEQNVCSVSFASDACAVISLPRESAIASSIVRGRLP